MPSTTRKKATKKRTTKKRTTKKPSFEVTTVSSIEGRIKIGTNNIYTISPARTYRSRSNRYEVNPVKFVIVAPCGDATSSMDLDQLEALGNGVLEFVKAAKEAKNV